MKYISILFITSLVSISCQNNFSIPDGYKKYQTFNQYSLIGISNNDNNIKLPYVLVKANTDTIYVIRSLHKDKILQYVNMGDFWYSMQTSEEFKNHIDICSEFFIFNDTILSCSYEQKQNSLTYYNVGVETKRDKIIIWNVDIEASNKLELYLKLKNLLSTYKENIPLFNQEEFRQSPSTYPICYYKSYIKVFKNNKLYLYKSHGTDRPVCLSDVFQLSSLGEFDRTIPKSIMREIANELKEEPICK